jgi:hypothetical protein
VRSRSWPFLTWLLCNTHYRYNKQRCSKLTNLFAVNVPSQLYSWFRSAGSAVHVDRVTGFVTVLSAGYAWSFVGRRWKGQRNENIKSKRICRIRKWCVILHVRLYYVYNNKKSINTVPGIVPRIKYQIKPLLFNGSFGVVKKPLYNVCFIHIRIHEVIRVTEACTEDFIFVFFFPTPPPFTRNSGALIFYFETNMFKYLVTENITSTG